jgi:hypothetical protein
VSQKRFNTTTFSELFVLLALVFLTQTLIHFSFSDAADSVPSPRQTAVFVNQYPSGGDKTDHIRYLSIGRYSLVISGSGCHATSFNRGAYSTKIEPGGKCRPRREIQAVYNFSNDALGEKNLEVFRERVKNEYGAYFAASVTEGLQNKFSIFFDPAVKRPDTLEIHIGVCVCALPATPNNLSIPSEWGLGLGALRTPHPVVIAIESIGLEKVKSRQHVVYSHITDFARQENGSLSPIPKFIGEYGLEADNCEMPRVADSVVDISFLAGVRSNYVFDYMVTWKELSSI